MSYQVLARKWRPHHFQEMVGQESVLRMLTNALDNQRLHHAYLFTGTRGVGKTTLARILAKCLNCEAGISSHPCNQCSICQAIDAGRFLDLLEVDAASRTKVEDTRELLDNVQYAPSQGRYKIYLIDEVHMLSGHSFNALLKTLEEPPAHVKFLLATTDPKKLPVTVLSRCLQFHLKRVPVEKITQQLQHICAAEHITAEASALTLLAQAADGSMRDALSLLDQAIAFCGGQITSTETRHMLGSIEQDALFRLLDALAHHDGQTLLKEITALSEYAPDFNRVLEDLLSLLHQIAITQIVAAQPDYDARIQAFAKQFRPEEVQLYYQIALIGRRDLPCAPTPQYGLEMVMLRMLAFQPETVSTVTPPQPTSVTPAPIPMIKTMSSPWSEILPQLGLSGMTYALASNCTLGQLSDEKIELMLSSKHEAMLNKKSAERLEQALSQHFNKPMKLDIKMAVLEIETPAKQMQQEKAIRHATATETIKNDNHVKNIMDVFNATIDMNSIKAIDPT